MHGHRLPDSCRFTVSGLGSGDELLLSVYSGNSRGRSQDQLFLHAHLPSLPVKQLETRHDTGEERWLAGRCGGGNVWGSGG